MMADYGRDVRAILQQFGCTFVRPGKGDHQIWYSPITKRNVIKSRHTANAIMKQAGIDHKF